MSCSSKASSEGRVSSPPLSAHTGWEQGCLCQKKAFSLPECLTTAPSYSQQPHLWSPRRKNPLHQDSPACYSQSHTDHNIAVLTLQILMAEDGQRFGWSCPASEFWKLSAAENHQSPAPWRVSDIFKWCSWQQREGLLVSSLLGHWFVFSNKKHRVNFFCKKNCCSNNTGNNITRRNSMQDRYIQRLRASW